MSFYLTVFIHCKEGNTAALKELLLSLVPQSRSEAACLQYDLHQSEEDKNLFIFQEAWASKAGWEAHNLQPYIVNFVNQSANLLEEPPRIYQTEKLV